MTSPLSLYVHWPFCLSKCPYCDFNSHVRDTIDEERWRRALLQELATVAHQVPDRRLVSIFFGGGTPSLMHPETVFEIIQAARSHWQAPANLEITLEANPTSVEAARLALFEKAGVNRLSLGVQALNDADLKFLGRTHGRANALEALKIAKDTFARVSFDLIYARPKQTLAAWQDELGEALNFACDHLSLYQLTIEQGTAFYAAHRRGDFVLPNEDLAADLFEMTQAMTTAAGLPMYEVSNHARVGQECQHNLVYWQGGDYAGIGPGAHGRLTLEGQTYATKRIRAPELWCTQVEATGNGADEHTPVTQGERLIELLMMGLRMTEGLSIATLETCAQRPFATLFKPSVLNDLCADDLLVVDAQKLRATPQGLQRLNGVLTYLLDGMVA